MRRLVVREHAHIIRWGGDGDPPRGTGKVHLERRLYERLKRFDQAQRPEADRVFAWGDGKAKALQWIGVIQVAGLQVEILPKIDGLSEDSAADEGQEARRNVLYMLAVAGDVPVRSRDVARLANRRAPLSETLAAIFADRLLSELLRGPERAYLSRMENLRCFKGKLVISRQMQHNAAHRERFYCRFDELCEDTVMNRIFRAACRLLLDATHTPATQDLLRHCLLLLDGVSNIFVHDALFDRVVINRQNERFADVLRFCRLILAGRSPTVQAGDVRSFSLLFDMNQVFERFIAGFMRSRVMPLLEGHQLFPQARQRQRHLMVCEDRGALPLRPDLLFEAPDGRRLVIDTKWKRLSEGKTRGGVTGPDLYQLFAYTRRYGSTTSILLYPHAAGVKCRDFDVIDPVGQRSGERVCVRFVSLHRNLHQEAERVALTDELTEIVTEGLNTPTPGFALAAAGGGG